MEVEKFFQEAPLYRVVHFEDNYSDVLDKAKPYLEFIGPLDVFCPFCECERTFWKAEESPEVKEAIKAERGRVDQTFLELSDLFNESKQYIYWALAHGIFVKTFICTRSANHRIHYVLLFQQFKSEQNKADVFAYELTKIGQYPSLADTEVGELKQYQKVLGEKYTEFRRAIGLASVGVGIGSFIYLRRVFEWLISEAREKALSDKSIDETTLAGKKMDDIIKILADYLPPFLVDNRALYGIMSKGVHELTEEECLKYFDVVMAAIKLILDQKVLEFERKKQETAAKQAIEKVRQELSSGAPGKTS